MAPTPKSDNSEAVPAECNDLNPHDRDICITEYNQEKGNSQDYSAATTNSQPPPQAQSTAQTSTPISSSPYAVASISSPPLQAVTTSSSVTPMYSSSPSPTVLIVMMSSGSTATSEAMSQLPYTTHTSSSPSASTSDVSPSLSNYPGDQHHTGIPGYLPAAAVLVPLIIIALIIGGIVKFIKRKRKLRSARNGHPGMNELGRNQARKETASVQPLPHTAPFMTPALPPASVPSTNQQPQPVILSSTVEQSYFTGIDTADRISLAPAPTQAPDAFAHSSNTDDPDEPPPPYRPRSVPPISRETSVRAANRPLNAVSRNSSQRTYQNDPLVSNGLMGPMRHSQDMHAVRSPFDDPTNGDDVVSEISAIHERIRGQDQLSAVSDLSYQEDMLPHR